MQENRGYFSTAFSVRLPARRIQMFIVVLITSLLFAGTPAATADGYGKVTFANSGAPAAQADFSQGMALLHDFEYQAAAAAFKRAQSADPGFAMAYWGEAMTFNHPLWAEQDLAAARAALNKLAPDPAARRAKAKTDREKAYLDAVEILYGEGSKIERDFRYQAAMAKLHERYPDDVDAAAFYALSTLGTAHAGRDIPTYMRAAGVLEEAWVSHQEHPGLVHYLIHSYDDPAHAPLGLRAARIYSRIAPDAGHAQHMCSHIFLALGMWEETVQANLAAMADYDRMRAAQGKGPARCGHYPSWLEYGYLQLGKMNEAKASLTACRATVESQASMDHPGMSMSMDPDSNLSSSFANMRLRYLLDTGEWTGEIANWQLPKSAGPGAQLDFAFARALGEIARGRAAEARQALSELEAVGGRIADSEARKANPDPSYRLRSGVLLLEARALLAEHEGDLPGAEKLLRQAIAIEETLPVDFGPPTIDKPTHELLGEFLFRRGRKDEARAEFEKALARTPGRRLAMQGSAAAGKK
jgi:tetratricopeptide (TPR) repeat protein